MRATIRSWNLVASSWSLQAQNQAQRPRSEPTVVSPLAVPRCLPQASPGSRESRARSIGTAARTRRARPGAYVAIVNVANVGALMRRA